MSNRVELNDHEVENVTGGVLIWGEGKTVSPKDDPSVVYHYTSFTKCMHQAYKWLDSRDSRYKKVGNEWIPKTN